MNELIEEFSGETIDEWAAWYQARHPEAIELATQKIAMMIVGLRSALDQVDTAMIRAWVEDLLFNKTFCGLKFQKSILLGVAEKEGLKFKPSDAINEAKGIDGYLSGKPVSVKPLSYKTKGLPETIDVEIIFYEKKKDGISVIYDSERLTR
jgi:hypothetical protein